jgi:hypothetical protein
MFKFEKLSKPIQMNLKMLSLNLFMQQKIMTLTLNYINTKKISCIILMFILFYFITTKC